MRSMIDIFVMISGRAVGVVCVTQPCTRSAQDANVENVFACINHHILSSI